MDPLTTGPGWNTGHVGQSKVVTFKEAAETVKTILSLVNGEVTEFTRCVYWRGAPRDPRQMFTPTQDDIMWVLKQLTLDAGLDLWLRGPGRDTAWVPLRENLNETVKSVLLDRGLSQSHPRRTGLWIPKEEADQIAEGIGFPHRLRD